jgi:SAM-dependent methyltransferase
MTTPVNKSMDRDDLLTPEGTRFVLELNELAVELERRKLPVTSWYGGLPKRGIEFSLSGMRSLAKRALGRSAVGSGATINRGGDGYEPLPQVACDDHHPWFLYWEAYWVTSRGPQLQAGDKVLDAGGTASLFSYYLASRGQETHSVDLNRRLVAAGDETAKAMDWNLHSYCMDMTRMKFDDASFDHAYSICVFEHLDADLRREALEEIARVLKVGGVLSLTFDYGAPGVTLAGTGPNYEERNLIRTPDEVHRHFFQCDRYEPVGNTQFFDNEKTYLVWPDDTGHRYSFGSVFLRKVR